MSVWEYTSAIDGWIAANSPEDAGGMTAEEEDAAWEAVKARMGRV